MATPRYQTSPHSLTRKFNPGVQTNIDEAEKHAGILKGRILALQRGVTLGEDSATQAGYDSSHSSRITALLRRIKDSSTESETLKRDLFITKECVKQAEVNSLAGPISGVNEEDQKRASSEVVKFIAESPDGVQTLLDPLGQFNPAVNTTIQNAMARSSDSNDVIVALQKQLESANNRINDLEKTSRGYKRAARRTKRKLHRVRAKKDRKIKQLHKSCDDEDDTINKRDGIDTAQVQDAEKSVLELVAKEALVNCTKKSLAPCQRQLWKVYSWSDETHLKVDQVDRGPEAIAIQILVALDGRSIETVGLLSLLNGLQTALHNSPFTVVSMIPMLLKAFTTVGANVHFMHQLAMCQIVHLLASTDEDWCEFLDALDKVDPRVHRLLNALKASTSELLVLQDSITVSNLAFVGLDRKPRGVIAVHLVDKEIRWVGLDHINKSFNNIKLSYMDQTIDISVNSTEISGWAMRHT